MKYSRGWGGPVGWCPPEAAPQVGEDDQPVAGEGGEGEEEHEQRDQAGDQQGRLQGMVHLPDLRYPARNCQEN